MFGVTMGITIAMISLFVLLPLITLVIYSTDLSIKEFADIVCSKRVLASFEVSILTALIAAGINAVMGFIVAWVLVRYEFPGKKIVDGMIELPFALPTAVAGMTLTSLLSDTGSIGGFFARFGIKIAYTRLGITIALVFVGIPFVVRSVQPVLEKLDTVYEEAASMMGANDFEIFTKIILPEVLPAVFVGFGLAFGRGIGEYGSVVFIAGNQPYKTEIVPLLIMSKLESFDFTSACAIALVLLTVSFFVLFLTNSINNRAVRRRNGGR